MSYAHFVTSMLRSDAIFPGLLLAIVQLTWAQTFTRLHSFTGNPDGATPYGGLVADRKGNLLEWPTKG